MIGGKTACMEWLITQKESERESVQPQMVRVAARGKQSHQSAPRAEREHGTGTKNRFVAGIYDRELPRRRSCLDLL